MFPIAEPPLHARTQLLASLSFGAERSRSDTRSRQAARAREGESSELPAHTHCSLVPLSDTMSFANDVIDLLGFFSFSMGALTLASFGYKMGGKAMMAPMAKGCCRFPAAEMCSSADRSRGSKGASVLFAPGNLCCLPAAEW